jgi:hypothetical protein
LTLAHHKCSKLTITPLIVKSVAGDRSSTAIVRGVRDFWRVGRYAAKWTVMSAGISTDDAFARDSPRGDLPTERSMLLWNWYNHPEDDPNRT